MDYILVFNNVKGTRQYLHLESMDRFTLENVNLKDTGKICVRCDEKDIDKINRAMDCKYKVVYSFVKSNYTILNFPFDCSIWDGKEFVTSHVAARAELCNLLEYRNEDKHNMLQKVMKIEFFKNNFDKLKDKKGKVNVYGKDFNLKDLESYYTYMFNDFVDLSKRIDEVKEYIENTDIEILITKKNEIIKNLVLTSIKEDYEFGELTKEEVINFYEKFIQNMKDLPFEIKFIPVKYIKNSSYYVDEDLNTYTMSAEKNNNHYMQNFKSQKLALDIYENGTFWPLFVTIFSDREYQIIEGNFRLGSIKSAIENGLIPEDFEMLAVTNRLKEDFKEVSFHIPYVENIEYMKNHTYYKFLYRCPNITRTECGKFFKVTFTRDYIQSYGSSFAANCINMYGIGLNNYVFKYKMKPSELPGNDYLNDKEKHKEYWNGRIYEFSV